MASVALNIWLVKESEPLPLGGGQRLYRTGLLARTLANLGHSVSWFSSRFEHGRKVFVKGSTFCPVSENQQVILLDGPGYKKNISLARISHHQKLATHFSSLSETLAVPDVILASYPSPEVCHAVCEYARSRQVPLILDVRDPWPDSFADYFPSSMRWVLKPVVSRYKNILRSCMSDATSVVSMSNMMLDWALSAGGRQRQPQDKVFYLGYERTGPRRVVRLPSMFSEADPLRCIFVGNFGASYDGQTLLGALQQLAKEGEKRIHCTLVGSGDNEKEWLQSAEGLSHVRFTGWLGAEALTAELTKAHVGLVPLHGGIGKFWMGNKLFEYASQGLAVINTAQGEPAEVLKRENFGVTVPVGDAAGIASALKSYADSPGRLSQHMRRSLNVFEEQFRDDVIYGMFADHVQAIAGVRSEKIVHG